jgi:hypothetical protein
MTQFLTVRGFPTERHFEDYKIDVNNLIQGEDSIGW